MYVKTDGVLAKSEEEFRKERHASVGMRAEDVRTFLPREREVPREKPFEGGAFTLPTIKPFTKWDTEEYLLLGLIVWQLLLKERDVLLIGTLVFLLLWD